MSIIYEMHVNNISIDDIKSSFRLLEVM